MAQTLPGKRFTALLVPRLDNLALATFVLLGLATFPLLIYYHFHLFADGSFFFCRMVEKEQFAAAGTVPSRTVAHWLTQLAPLLAIRLGVTDWGLVSRLYGISLFYLPLLCYLAAAMILHREGMRLQLVLLCLLYLLLTLFCSWFIVSEAHLGSALFCLTIALLHSRSSQRPAGLLVLLLLALAAHACYEFWAAYFPVCFILLLKTQRSHERLPHVGFLRRLLGFLYLTGFASSALFIYFSPFADNRNTLLSRDLLFVTPYFAGLLIGYGSLVAAGITGRSSLLRRLGEGASVVLFLLLAFTMVFKGFPSPWSAYYLRSLSLLLPLLFSLSFLFPDPERKRDRAAAVISRVVLLPMLLLTLQAQILFAAQWRDFRHTVLDGCSRGSGYVSVREVPLSYRSLLWDWSLPSLSFSLQAILGDNQIRGVLYNPNASWQPYGPLERKDAWYLAWQFQRDFPMEPDGTEP